MSEGVKYDAGKPRWDLIPWAALEEVVLVLNEGAKKYSDDNWQHVRPLRRRYFAACQRHLVAWVKGHEFDPDDGHRHLAHAICCLLFLLADQQGDYEQIFEKGDDE